MSLTHARGLPVYRGARQLRATAESGQSRHVAATAQNFAGGVGPLRLCHPRAGGGAPLWARVCCVFSFGGASCGCCFFCCVFSCSRLGAAAVSRCVLVLFVAAGRCSFLAAVAGGAALVVVPSRSGVAACWLVAGFVAGRVRLFAARGSRCRVRFGLAVVGAGWSVVPRSVGSAAGVAWRCGRCAVRVAGRPSGRPVFAKSYKERKTARGAAAKRAGDKPPPP